MKKIKLVLLLIGIVSFNANLAIDKKGKKDKKGEKGEEKKDEEPKEEEDKGDKVALKS